MARGRAQGDGWMKVEFLGVGEACDELLPNTSILVECPGQGGRTILLDCGFTAASPYLQRVQDPERLDAVWVSHFHGDHFFGLPQLLLRFWETGRSRPLICIGQQRMKDVVSRLMDMAYPGLAANLGFDLEWQVLEPDNGLELGNLNLSCAPTDHPQPNLALRLECGGRSMFYSGDGGITSASRDLARQCDLAVHEAFVLTPASNGHGSVQDCLDMAAQAGVNSLALVHIQRTERPQVKHIEASELKARAMCPVLVPEPGESLSLG